MMRTSVIDDQCPTDSYKPGEPKGRCWSDGHYECKGCEHYREDFKRLGQEHIDFVHILQGQITFSTYKLIP